MLGIKINTSEPPIAPSEGATFPFQAGTILKKIDEKYSLTSSRYSLTPQWSKEEKPKFATYNARLTRSNSKSGKLEKIYEVPSWKDSFGKQNCIVPVDEFFESCREGEAAGNMVAFFPKSKPILLVAGIWNDWLNQHTGELISTFAIVTTEPTEEIQRVGHDRSPVILDETNTLKWLSGFPRGSEAFDFLNSRSIKADLSFRLVRKLKKVKI
ncbi:MAG: SOS response-associated peptidase family protein [Bdellovibrionaceae bacterium]|nr:SOS response-associated peptidase family protein [Pseudobdellovibrionaceae bacterium]